MLVAFDLLDRQIIDLDGAPVGNVDDVELAVDESGTPYVVALLVGPLALGPRLGGVLGRFIFGLAELLHTGERPEPIRIAFDHVARVGPAIDLSIRKELLREPALETWLREHVIRKIPGAEHASA